MSGDGLAFFSLLDAMSIQYDYSGEAIRLERKARRSRLARQDVGNTLPTFWTELNFFVESSCDCPSFGKRGSRAVEARDQSCVGYGNSFRVTDVTAFTKEEQKQLLLKGVVDRARRQSASFVRFS